MTIEVTLRDPASVMTTTMFGERVVNPEFVGATCGECGAGGVVSENIYLEGERRGEEVRIRCVGCTEDRP